MMLKKWQYVVLDMIAFGTAGGLCGRHINDWKFWVFVLCLVVIQIGNRIRGYWEGRKKAEDDALDALLKRLGEKGVTTLKITETKENK